MNTIPAPLPPTYTFAPCFARRLPGDPLPPVDVLYRPDLRIPSEKIAGVWRIKRPVVWADLVAGLVAGLTAFANPPGESAEDRAARIVRDRDRGICLDIEPWQDKSADFGPSDIHKLNSIAVHLATVITGRSVGLLNDDDRDASIGYAMAYAPGSIHRTFLPGYVKGQRGKRVRPFVMREYAAGPNRGKPLSKGDFGTLVDSLAFFMLTEDGSATILGWSAAVLPAAREEFLAWFESLRKAVEARIAKLSETIPTEVKLAAEVSTEGKGSADVSTRPTPRDKTGEVYARLELRDLGPLGKRANEGVKLDSGESRSEVGKHCVLNGDGHAAGSSEHEADGDSLPREELSESRMSLVVVPAGLGSVDLVELASLETRFDLASGIDRGIRGGTNRVKGSTQKSFRHGFKRYGPLSDTPGMNYYTASVAAGRVRVDIFPSRDLAETNYALLRGVGSKRTALGRVFDGQDEKIIGALLLEKWGLSKNLPARRRIGLDSGSTARVHCAGRDSLDNPSGGFRSNFSGKKQ